ncbi:MAG TPA: hypothetical protein VFU71_13045 [Burkholderiaceae bacterium]|nr:hypothetical protein [Burkholderiaceae bacterium]
MLEERAWFKQRAHELVDGVVDQKLGLHEIVEATVVEVAWRHHMAKLGAG